MQELGFPSTLHLLGNRDGISFYAARNPDGHFCFAIGSDAGKSVGCTDAGGFPSAQEPVVVFPGSGRLAGVAADGVASVLLLDAAGSTLASAQASDNLFVGSQTPAGYATIEALDAQGYVISRHRAAATGAVTP